MQKKHWHFCFFILVGFLLTGCSTQSSLTNPYSLAPNTPYSSWSKTKGSTLISSQFCDTYLPSKDSEEKLSLAELIDIGLRNNPRTKKTWAEARSASATYGQSLSDYLPELEFKASYLRERSVFFDITDFIPFYQTIVNPEFKLTYTLLDFGKRKNSSESARQMLYVADAMHNREIQVVVQSVTTSYFNYLFEKQSLIAKEADLRNAEASLDAANQRFKLGLGALGDVTQARTEYLQNKINLINQKQSVEDTYATLAENLGLPANHIFQVEDLPEHTDTVQILEGLDDLIAKAQEQRQDFLAAQAEMRAKIANLKKAKADYYPTITGSFDIGNYFYNGGAAQDYYFSAMVSLNLPIFKGFFYKNAVNKARADVRTAEARVIQKELAIVKDVTVSHYIVKTSAEVLDTTVEYLEEARKRYDIAFQNYKSGTGTILDVISAQSSLADARSKLADGKRDWYSSLSDLAFSTGTLCSAPLRFE